MSDQPNLFDPRIADWLEDGPDKAPSIVLDSLAAALPSIPQRHSWREFRRYLQMPRFAIPGVVTVVLAVAAAALLMSRAIAPGPGSSSSPDTSAISATSSPRSTSPEAIPPNESALPAPTASVEPAPTSNPGLIRIAFEECDTGEIYTMNEDGTDIVNLTNSSTHEADPAWSPDRTRIAFSSGRGDSSDSDIYTMKADGSEIVLVKRNALGPAWSPDGTKIAFVSTTEGGIHVMNADGSMVEKLTDVGFPSDWSPDGTRIVFSGPMDIETRESDIYVINADGSGVTDIAGSGGFWEAPQWSPDGTKIAFQSNMDGNWGIYTMDPDGSNVVRLDSLTRPETRKGLNSFAPSWSPDGTGVAFVQSENGIFTMNADGSNEVLVLAQSSDIPCAASPDW
jgi:Tol biopolymer transport system component